MSAITRAPFDEICRNLRTEIKTAAAQINELRNSELTGLDKPESHLPEMYANLVLAYRHLEDAAMRLGKAIQAWDGGRSVYDKWAE